MFRTRRTMGDVYQTILYLCLAFWAGVGLLIWWLLP
jgi:hypothetical protein